MGAPDGGAGSSQHGASTVVSSRVLGAGLRLRVRQLVSLAPRSVFARARQSRTRTQDGLGVYRRCERVVPWIDHFLLPV